MPTGTELIISIGEVLECIPPGKSYRRKRYNSFDANQSAAIEAENEENVAPLIGVSPCLSDLSLVGGGGGMKSKENGVSEQADIGEPQVLAIRRKTRGSEDGRKHYGTSHEDDDEVSFNTDSVGSLLENGNGASHNGDDAQGAGKPKGKRKSSAEKFLEDNANYFQLEVLSSKTRSTKTTDDAAGYYNSFLDFLKAKNSEMECGEDSSDTERSRTRHKSGPAGGPGNNRAMRQRTASFHQSPSHSDSEDSIIRAPRSRSLYRGVRSRSRARTKSRERDVSPSESEPESLVGKGPSKGRRSKKRSSTPVDSSDDESEIEQKVTRSSSNKQEVNTSPSPSKKTRRSELDKLLEAVDTSFHFETAAEAAKRLGGGSLGPLEIDVSDSNCDSEIDAPNTRKKRKASESDFEPDEKKKKAKNGGNNLLKTFSPYGSRKSCKVEPVSENETSEDLPSVDTDDGCNSLDETLAGTDSDPVHVDSLHFSFEYTPMREGWFRTYSRQDAGEDIVFYPEMRSFPFRLPYEMPYSTFMPYKLEPKDKVPIKPEGKSPILEKAIKGRGGKFKKRKLSDSESTDSETYRRGRGKFGIRAEHLQELNHRVSPRCHASTKAVLHGGIPLADDAMAEAFILQDDRDAIFPGIASVMNVDETSNDSISSARPRYAQRESVGEYLQLAASLDKLLRSTNDFATVGSKDQASAEPVSPTPGDDKDEDEPVAGKSSPDKLGGGVPTRSRISSEDLLKTKKDKHKKKREKLSTPDTPFMDQFVADNVDAVLLDCLEEELPTVPFDFSLPGSDPVFLLDTYQNCNSMAACNSRWLRPSRPSVLGPKKGDDAKSHQKKYLIPPKPKRLVIYKEDLPGFKYDNDIEPEKLPVSKRCLAKTAVKEEQPEAPIDRKEAPPRKTKKQLRREIYIQRKGKMAAKTTTPNPVKEEPQSDEESVSSRSSITSRRKGKRKINRSGFPNLKKKKKPAMTESMPSKKPALISKRTKAPVSAGKLKKAKASPPAKVQPRKVPIKTPPVNKEVVGKKKKRMSPPQKASATNVPVTNRHTGNELGKRSATLQAKNYSELESDTESLFESKVPYRSPHLKNLLAQAAASTPTSSKRKSLGARKIK